MGIRPVRRFCLIYVILLFNNQEIYGSSGSTPGTSTNNTSTNFPAASNNSRKQSPIELIVTDLKKTLKVLLGILNENPDAVTLKTVTKIINDIIKEDSTTKDLHAKVMKEFRKHAQLKKWLNDLKVDIDNVEKSSEFELFPALLRNAIIQEVLKFHNLSDTEAESVTSTENDSTNTSTDDNLTTTIQPETTSSKQVSTAPSNNSIDTTQKTVDRSVNLQKNVSEISETPEMKSEDNQQPNTNVTIRQIVDKILDNKQNAAETFPNLSENRIHIFSKYNLKFIRTYSEIIEPLSLHQNQNKKNKGDYKQKRCQTVGKKKQIKGAKKPKIASREVPNFNSCNNNARDLLKKIIDLVNDTCSVKTAKNSSTQNKPSTTNTPVPTLQEKPTAAIDATASILIPAVDLTDSTKDPWDSTALVARGIEVLASTRKPNRPPGKVLASTRKPNRPPGSAFEPSPLFPSPTFSSLSTKFDNSHT